MLEFLLRLQCSACQKSFVVEEADVDQDFLTCPFCEQDISIPDEDDE